MLEGDKIALYQWDLNQRLIFTDIQENAQVHFSKVDDDKESLVLLTYEENGKYYCNIPNILLQEKGIIYVYIYVQEDDKTHTKYEAEILVLFREKPSDYIYTETEVLSLESLEKRVKRIEEEGIPEGLIEETVDKYLTENPLEIEVDESLKYENGVLKVNTTEKVEEGNMLPLSSAAVYVTVGNIEALLNTI